MNIGNKKIEIYLSNQLINKDTPRKVEAYFFIDYMKVVRV